MARWKLALGTSILGTLVALGGAEIWARQQVPTRIQQIYSADQYELEIVEGVPTWLQNPQDTPRRWNLDCIEERPDAARVVILGSSIFYGVRLDHEDTLGSRLEALWEHSSQGPPCFSNLSEAGFTFQNQWARARSLMGTLQPDVLVVEIWHNSPTRYQMLDNAAYNFGRLELDDSGFPNPYGLDSGLNHWLLDRSGLFRYLVFGSTPESSGDAAEVWNEFADTEITELMDWAEAEDVELLLVFCPALGTDFETTAERSLMSYGPVETRARERGVETIYLAREFTGMDPEALGLDSCCHFNPKGMNEVAIRIARALDGLLAPAEQDAP